MGSTKYYQFPFFCPIPVWGNFRFLPKIFANPAFFLAFRPILFSRRNQSHSPDHKNLFKLKSHRAIQDRSASEKHVLVAQTVVSTSKTIALIVETKVSTVGNMVSGTSTTVSAFEKIVSRPENIF